MIGMHFLYIATTSATNLAHKLAEALVDTISVVITGQ